MHQLHILSDTTVIDFLVNVVFLLGRFWYWKFAKLMLDSHFSFHIADVIALEGFPFLRCMKRVISGPATIGLCSSARLVEVFDGSVSF